MFETALSSSVLILVVLLIRLVCQGKISARFQYALWLLVLVRLLLPVSFGESAFSVMNAVPEERTQTAAAVPLVQAPVPAASAWTEPVQAAGDFVPMGTEQPVQSPGQAPDQGAASRWTISNWLELAWLLGALAVGLVFAAENLACARRLRRRRVPFQGEVSGCTLPVYVAEGLPSPCLFGIFRPAIYLTPGAARNGAAIPHILAHEQTHYRHLDHIWPLFRALAAAMYWWNPLVWLAACCSRVDCELACDEGALKVLGEELRFEYGRTLVGLVSVKRTPSGLLSAATTMTGSKKELKRRLNLILRRPRPVLPVLVCAVLAAAVAVGCTFTGAESSEISPIQGSDQDTPGQEVSGVDGSAAFPEGMEDAIHQSILDYNRGRYLEGEFACESHEIFASALVANPDDPEGAPLTKVLAMVLYQEYNYQRTEYDVMATGLQAVSGGHVPTVLTFRETEHGGYALTDYWEPGDGERYHADLEKMCQAYFPAYTTGLTSFQMLDAQNYVVSQTQECYAQAIQYGRVAAWSIVAGLLEEYAQSLSSAALSPASGGSGRRPTQEIYRELMYYGDYTLSYIYTQFLQGEQSGAMSTYMSDIMRVLLADEALDRSDISGQAYFDAWLAELLQLRGQGMSLDEMREARPKSALLFSLVSSQASQNVRNSDWFQDMSAGPMKVVWDTIESWREEDYAIFVEPKEVAVDLDETAWVVQRYFNSPLAQDRGWTYDIFVNHFAVVRARYEAEYDHAKTFLTDGNLAQFFYLVQDEATGTWSIVDTTSPEEDGAEVSAG